MSPPCAAAALVLLLAAPPSPADRLAALDAALDAPGAAHLRLEVTLTDARGDQRARTFDLWRKGARRLVRVVAPARLRGTALLSSGEGAIHTWLPAYGRVRRLTGRARAGAFASTSFTVEDLGRAGFSAEYQAVSAEGPILLLRPRDPAAHAHAFVRLHLDAHELPTRAEFLDADRRPLRTVAFADVRDHGGRRVAHHVRVTDHRTGRASEARVVHLQLDAPLEDAFFTAAALAR